MWSMYEPRYDDLPLLDDCSKSVLGFFVHRWFTSTWSR